MSYTLNIEDTDKLRYVMGRLRGRPGVTRFAAPVPEPISTAVLCLHIAPDGNQSLILCVAEADYNACKTLAGRVQFFRVFRALLAALHPDTASLFSL